jgi:hypothetical protein
VIVVMSGFISDDSDLFEYMTSVAWDLIVGLSFVQFFCFCFCFCFCFFCKYFSHHIIIIMYHYMHHYI